MSTYDSFYDNLRAGGQVHTDPSMTFTCCLKDLGSNVVNDKILYMFLLTLKQIDILKLWQEEPGGMRY